MFTGKKKTPFDFSKAYAVIPPKAEEGPIVPEKFDDVALTGKVLDDFKNADVYQIWTTLSPALRSAFELGHVNRVYAFPAAVILNAETPPVLFEMCKVECSFVKVSKIA